MKRTLHAVEVVPEEVKLSLACELLDRRTFKRRDQARLEVFEFIEGF